MTVPVRVPDGVPLAFVEQLTDAMVGLDEWAGPDSAATVLGYLLHGEPADPWGFAPGNLLLARMLGGGHVWWPKTHDHLGPGPRDQLPADTYTWFGQLPVPVALRWATLIDALPTTTGDARPQCFEPPAEAPWLEPLLAHGQGLHNWGRMMSKGDLSRPSFDAVRRLLAEAGAAPDTLPRVIFEAAAPGALMWLRNWPGWADVLAGWGDGLRRTLAVGYRTKDARRLLQQLQLIDTAHDATLVDRAEELADLATCGHRRVRAAVRPLFLRTADAGIEALVVLAGSAQPAQRAQAFELCRELITETDARHHQLRELAGRDRSTAVRELVRRWDAVPPPAVPPPAAPPTAVPLDVTPEIDAWLETFWTAFEGVGRANKHRWRTHARAEVTDTERAAARACLATTRCDCPDTVRPPGHAAPADVFDRVRLDDVPQGVLLGLLHHLSGQPVHVGYDWLHSFYTEALKRIRAGGRGPSLFEVERLVHPYGGGPETIIRSYCAGPDLDWDGEIGAFLATRPEVVVRMLQVPIRDDYCHDRARLFTGLAAVAELSVPVADALFVLALGTGKTDRPLAQQVLGGRPGTPERVTAALGDRKLGVRVAAADWLARLRHVPAEPALLAALATETKDAARSAFRDALAAIGRPLPDDIDRSALTAEAARGLAGPLPAEIEWLLEQALPDVRWVDTGEPVPGVVVRWLVVRAARRGSPEPDAMLRQVARLLAADDREILGQQVLLHWIEQDTAGRSLQEMFVDAPGPTRTALPSRGMLAVAAACAGGEAAPVVRRYLDAYYGYRSHQCLALVRMLAWVDHPSAVHTLLALARRFRTRGIQQEAEQQLRALAARRHWTLEELADRTVPTAGLDDDGRLALDYGPRRFTAGVGADLALHLTDQHGARLSALPAPRVGDDPELAAAAKRAFTAARKDLKGVVQAQAQRLHEAMCTGRSWSTADWQQNVLRHPVLARVAQRLVWLRLDGDTVVGGVRPLDDGTLTDVDDEPVQLDPAGRIALAHSTLLSGPELAGWQRHLADYLVAPLIVQFGRAVTELLGDPATSTALTDVHGHLIDAFSLRAKASSLGYQRGPNADGAWFTDYLKRFPGIDLTVVLTFTGNQLPEANRSVALETFHFAGSGPGWLPLDRVPPVLLAEVRADAREIAAAGSGYDPEWEHRIDR